MKGIPTWACLALSCALVALSCSGDDREHGAPGHREQVGSTRQGVEVPVQPKQPRPFELPEEPIVRGSRAGYLPGWGEVTPDGAYAYTIPIEVPPGRGLQPDLAITYSSRAGNGLLGMGFALSGLSSIQRCPKTMAIDGVVDGVDNDSSDVLCLDGQRLVSIRGAYGADGTEYRTEEDSFTKVVSHGALESFTAWLKDGRIRKYAWMGPLEWKMTEESDRSGNVISYTYEETYERSREYLLTSIAYASVELTFGYSPRDDPSHSDPDWRPDWTASYTAGERRYQVKLLGSISAFGVDRDGRHPLWQTTLAYEPSADTGRERLTEIKRCGTSGGCTMGRQFRWTSRHGDWFREAYSEEHSVFTGAHGPIVMDVDGDGKDELLLGTSDPAFRYVLLRGGPSAPPLSVRVSPTGVGAGASFFDGVDLELAKPVDSAGDGTSEIMAYHPDFDRYMLYKWVGDAFQLTSTSVPISPELPEYLRLGRLEPFHFVDIDGDGLADLMKLVDNVIDGSYAPKWIVRRNLLDGTFGLASETGISLGTAGDRGWDSVAIDVQGDGRGGLWPKGASQVMYPDDAGGFGLEDLPPDHAGEFLLDSFMADVNGDGLRDRLVYRGQVGEYGERLYVDVSWNNGKGFVGVDGFYGPVLHGASFHAVDIDGDGREDLVEIHNEAPQLVAISMVSGGSITQSVDLLSKTIAEPTTRIMALRSGDFDGDGLTDLVYLGQRCESAVGGPPEGPTAPCVFGTKFGSVHVLLQQSTVVDVVDQVFDEGSFAREEIEYSRQWTDAPEQPTCAYPQVCQRRGLPVVRRHRLDEGGTAQRERFFSYDDPRSDRWGRGFLGFGEVRVWEPQAPRETVTTFDHATRVGTRYPFALRPSTVTVATPILEDGDAGPTTAPAKATARLMRTTYHDETRDLNGGLTHAVFPHDWRSEEWEEKVDIDWQAGIGTHVTGIDGPGQSALRTREGSTEFDAWGGLVHQTSHTIGGVRTVTTADFEHRVDDWLLGLPRWQEVTSTTADGVTSTTRHTRFSFNGRGLLQLVSLEPTGSDDDHASVTYDYDGEGLLRTVTENAAGVPPRRLHLEYDGTPGHVAPSLIWNDLGHARWLSVHPGYGVVMAEMDADGVQTRWTHDDLGRPVTEETDGEAKRTWHYAQRSGGVQVEASDATGARSTVQFDLAGRPSRVARVGFDGTEVFADTVYDPLGRVVRQSRMGRSEVDGKFATQVFDSLGRVLRTVAPDGATTRYRHGFLESWSWDPMGSESKRVRDLDERIVQSVSYLESRALTTRYVYGPFDQVEQITDPRTNVTTVGYDVRGRRTRLTDPDKGTTRYFYNGLGDLRRQETSGDVTVYERDDLGRATRVTSVDGVTEYGWDVAEHGIGQLARTTSPGGTITDHTYTKYGWPEEMAWTVRGETFAVRLQYDAQGRVNKVLYPEVPGAARRFAIERGYSTTGYLKTIKDVTAAAVPLWEVNERSDDGALKRGTYGSGLQTVRSYDPVTGRLATQEENDGGVLSSLAYDYYADGRVWHRTERHRGAAATIDERKEEYGYDTLHRLRSWTLSAGSTTTSTAYDFDDLGNLTRVLTGGVERERNEYLDPRPHAVSANRDGAFTHDARGRMDQGAGRTIGYTDFDLPRWVTTSAGTTQLDYDASGVRVRKEGPAGTTISIAGLYERRQTAAGTQHVFTVPGSDGPVAQVVMGGGSGGSGREVQYLHQDALGSVTLVTNGRGEAVAHRYYEPFGKRIASDGGAPAEPVGDLRMGLTGHQIDDELGLINMRGRVYDPQLKRMLTPDPHVTWPMFGQSYHRYSYVLNDPVNLVDPTGYDGDCPGCGTPPQPRGPDEVSQAGSGGPSGQGGSSGGSGTRGGGGTRAFKNAPKDPPKPQPVAKSDVDGASGQGAETRSWRDSGVVQVLGGFVVGLGLGVVPGGGVADVTGRAAGVLDEGTYAAQVGKAVGEIVGGIALTGSGIAGEAASGALTATGIGAFLGVPAAVVSAVAVTGGAVNVSVGMANLTQALSKGSGSGGAAGAAPAAAQGGAANWKSVNAFQHTFKKHGQGAKITRSLTDTARSTNTPQGQWLNNQAAADLLQSHRAGLSGPASVPIPEGLGQVIMPDGSIVSATRATLVPGQNGFVTAYPIP